jgi:uncharacterized lipoprotein YehR (DUF1307 family)
MSDLKKVLDNHGVQLGVVGSKQKRITNALAAELYGAKPDEQSQILTRHGANLVLASAKGGRVSYKALGAYLYQEAEKMVAAVETRHAREIAALTEKMAMLENLPPPKAIAAPTPEVESTEAK